MKYIVDIKGEIEGDYEIISKYEERPQGEWTTVKGIEGAYYCSECDGDIDWKSRYCPWCGAKMEVDYE